MGKYDLPDLPSDDELGITEEDRRAYEEDLPAERPELSDAEMAALLGETARPEGAAAPPSRKEKRARAKKEKKQKKAKPPKEKRVKEAAAKALSAGEGATAGSSPATPGGAAARWRGPVTLGLLLGVAVLSSSRMTMPSPVPANASDTVFSSARAMSTLTEIARRPRPPGSPEHARVRAYLTERLRGLGMEPEVETATSVVQDSRAMIAATVRNLVVRIPGSASTGAILITAHYDSRELSPGAGDDGTGVVTILEALRAVRAGGSLRNDVIVLLTDAEEAGLLGARAFARDHPWMRDVALVLSFEMRGGGGPSMMFETGAENGWVVRQLADFDPRPLANSMSTEVYRRMPNDTDFTPFREAGKQGLNFAAVGRAHVYHQPTDTPENLDEATLQHHGVRAVAALRHFGNLDLGEGVTAGDAVFFTVPFFGLLVYDGSWVLPVTGGLLLLLFLAAGAALRAGAGVGGLVTGLGLAILGGALSYGIALGLGAWVARFHPEAGHLDGSLFHLEGWYVLALVGATLAVVTALHAVARRWLSPLELLLGAALIPFAVAAWASFAAPLAAMNLQWPVAASLLAVITLALLGSRRDGAVGWLAVLVLTAPVLAFLVPLVELLWLAFSLSGAGMIAVLVAVTLHLSLPALDTVRRPNGWWAPLTGVLVAASALAIGVRSARPTATRPAPSTLIYTYEHGTGAARWVTDPGADILLDEEAIDWAAARAAAPFDGTDDVRPYGLAWAQAPVATAPLVTAPRPEVVILTDTIAGTQRRVAFGVRSRVGAERLTLTLDAAGRTRFLAVNGVAVGQPGSLERVQHWGEPDSLLVVEVDMPAAEPIGVHVVEDLWRPEQLLGAGAFARPPHLAPDTQSSSDRAILRTSLAAFADPRHGFMEEATPATGTLTEPGAQDSN